MRYVLKQKLVSLGSNFTIKDSAGRDAFRITGELLTLGEKLSFQDLAGKELIRIEQRVVNRANSYQIRREGKYLADVRRDVSSFFRHRFTIEVRESADLEAVGDFLDRKYVLKRAEQEIGTMSKRWFRPSETYTIEINDSENDRVLILAIAVVIERACRKLQNR
ncbi:MAG: LURP-one-related/scramblase family protein [Gemmatimonadaceae bacterium]